jgi:two-component system chemotaxis response regulator CheY
MNILVVEDDEGCSQLLRDLLSQEPDCTPIFAVNGAEAWWMLSDSKRHFDMGIFDLKMPVVDGISLLKRIRETPKLKDLPIIVCTGINERRTIQEAAQYAVQQYIIKPYSSRAMLDKIRLVAQSVPKPRPAGINLVMT